MAKFSFDRLLSRGANAATFWTLVPGGLVAVAAGFLARGVASINAYGPFGWLMAGVAAFVLTTLAIFLGALAFDRFAASYVRRKWARDVDSVNPLDPEFTRKRLKISDLVHPITGRIVGKRFVDCQLLGPANIVTVGQTLLSHANLMNCDIVIHRHDVFIANVVVLDDVTIIGGEIIKCTIYVSQEGYDATFAQMPGNNLVSYSRPWQAGDEEDGEQSPGPVQPAP